MSLVDICIDDCVISFSPSDVEETALDDVLSALDGFVFWNEVKQKHDKVQLSEMLHARSHGTVWAETFMQRHGMEQKVLDRLVSVYLWVNSDMESVLSSIASLHGSVLSEKLMFAGVKYLQLLMSSLRLLVDTVGDALLYCGPSFVNVQDDFVSFSWMTDETRVAVPRLCWVERKDENDDKMFRSPAMDVDHVLGYRLNGLEIAASYENAILLRPLQVWKVMASEPGKDGRLRARWMAWETEGSDGADTSDKSLFLEDFEITMKDEGIEDYHLICQEQTFFKKVSFTSKPDFLKCIGVMTSSVHRQQDHYDNLVRHSKHLCRLSHESLAPYLPAHSSSSDLLCYTKIPSGVSLESLIGRGELKDMHSKIKIAKMISDGLSYLHDVEIAHGFLEAKNVILISSSTVQLVDYGWHSDFTPVAFTKQSFDCKHLEQLVLDIRNFGLVMLEMLAMTLWSQRKQNDAENLRACFQKHSHCDLGRLSYDCFYGKAGARPNARFASWYTSCLREERPRCCEIPCRYSEISSKLSDEMKLLATGLQENVDEEKAVISVESVLSRLPCTSQELYNYLKLNETLRDKVFCHLYHTAARAGLLDCLLKLMAKFDQSARVFACCCRCIGTMCRDISCCQLFNEMKGMTVVAARFSGLSYADEAVAACCLLIANLNSQGAKEFENDCNDSDKALMEVLSALMQKLQSPESLQVSVLKHLADLSLEDRISQILVELNVLDVSFNVIKVSDNSQLRLLACTLACRAINHALLDDEMMKEERMKMIVDLLVESYNDGDLMLARECSALISSIIKLDCRFLSQLEKIGGIAAMVRGLEAFAEDVVIVEGLCLSLHRLSENNLKRNMIISDCQGVNKIIRCMETHRDNVRVMAAGCQALGSLAMNNYKNKEEMSKQQVVQLVLSAMELESGVLIEALKSLLSICCNHQQNIELLLENLETVIQATRKQTHDFNACKAALDLLAMTCRVGKGMSMTPDENEMCELVWSMITQFSTEQSIIKSGLITLSSFPTPRHLPKDKEMRRRIGPILLRTLVEAWDSRDVRQACFDCLASFEVVEMSCQPAYVSQAFQLALTSVKDEKLGDKNNKSRVQTLLTLVHLLPVTAYEQENQAIANDLSKCLDNYQNDLSVVIPLLDCLVFFICKLPSLDGFHDQVRHVVKLAGQLLPSFPAVQERLCDLLQIVSKSEIVDETFVSDVMDGLTSPSPKNKMLTLIASCPEKFSSRTVERAVDFAYHHISSENNSEEEVCQCIDDLRKIFLCMKQERAFAFKTSNSFMSSLVSIMRARHVRVKNKVLTSHMVMLLVQDKLENCMLFAEHDGISVALALVDEADAEDSDSITLVSNVCGVLARAAAASLKLRVWMFNEDAVPRLSRLLSVHFKNADMLWNVCDSLNNLFENNVQSIDKISDMGGKIMFLKIIQQHKSNPALVDVCLQILYKLFSKCYDDRTNKTLTQVFAAMWAHELSANVQQHGCATLFSIVQSKVVKDLSPELPNFISAVKTSLLSHSSAGNTHSACKLLLELYKQQPASTVLVLDDRLATVVIKALQVYSHDKDVIDIVVKLLHKSLLCYRESPISQETVKQSVIINLSEVMELHCEHEELQTTFLRLFHAVLLDNKCHLAHETLRNIALRIMRSLELFDAPTLRIYGCRSLSAVFQDDSKMQDTAREENFVSVMMSLLEHADDEHLVLESVLLMIRSFSQGNVANANLLYQSGISKTIFHMLLTNQDPAVREKASQALSAAAVFQDQSSLEFFTDDDLSAIKSLLLDNSDRTITEQTILSTCKFISAHKLYQTGKFSDTVIYPALRHVTSEDSSTFQFKRGLVFLENLFEEMNFVSGIDESTMLELVETLLQTLTKKTSFENDDAIKSLAILGSICANSERMLQQILAQGGFQIVVNLIKTSQTLDILARALKTLHVILLHEKATLLESDVLNLLLSCMKVNMNSGIVQEQLLSNLHLAFSRREQMMQDFVDRQGLSLLTECMKAHQGSSKIQQLCLVVVSMFCETKFKEAMEELNVSTSVLHIMKLHDKDIAVLSHGCRLIAWYAWTFPSSRNLIGERHGVESIAGAMRKFPGDEQLQLTACDALAYLTKQQHKNGITLASEGGIEVLCDVMRRFLSNHTILEVACMILYNIAQIALKYCTSIVQQGAVELVLEGMERHPERLRLQERSCLVLWSLARYATIKRSMDSEASINKLAVLLCKQSPGATLLEYVCMALAVFVDEDAIVHSLQGGAVDRLYVGIQHNLTEAPAQQAAWNLIRLLAIKYGGEDFFLVKARAIPLALEVLLGNLENVPVQQECLKALQQLILRCVWGEEDRLQDEIISTVKQVRAFHGKKDECIYRVSRRILGILDRSQQACLRCFR
eukprot:768710-Hanusia_phi.AAC.1